MNAKPMKITSKQLEQLNKKLTPVYGKICGLTFGAGLLVLLAKLTIDKVNGTLLIFSLVFVAICVQLVLFINSRMLRKAIAKSIAELED